MEIYAASKKLGKVISSEKRIYKVFGSLTGKKIVQRLSEISAANTLKDISHLPPPRLHLLSGNRNNQFAVSLNGNERLIFEGLDLDGIVETDKEKVVSVNILEVVDYHGK